MSTLSGLISAGGGGGALPQIALTQSQTWVPPQDGNICIHVIGAGGAGDTSNSTHYSGGAGGYCKKNSLAVTTSGSYTVVVGVGGPRNTAGAAPSSGGNSTVAGTGLSSTLTANGGSASGSGQGAGGSASNGDVNNTGGAGIDQGGGGAVGVYGTGNAGTSNRVAGQSDAAADGIGLSGFGHITGGNAGSFLYFGDDDGAMSGPENGGPLSGGGAASSTALYNTVVGGNGGIGAGGGSAKNAASANYAISGAGGDGLVLIQYLPS